MSYEILAAARVGPRKRHPDRAALVTAWIHLIPYRVAWATIPIVARIAVLRNEIRNHAVKARVAIVSRSCEAEEIPDRDRSVGAKHLEVDRPSHGVDRRSNGLAGICRHHNRPHDLVVPRARPRASRGISPGGPDGNRFSC